MENQVTQQSATTEASCINEGYELLIPFIIACVLVFLMINILVVFSIVFRKHLKYAFKNVDEKAAGDNKDDNKKNNNDNKKTNNKKKDNKNDNDKTNEESTADKKKNDSKKMNNKK